MKTKVIVMEAMLWTGALLLGTWCVVGVWMIFNGDNLLIALTNTGNAKVMELGERQLNALKVAVALAGIVATLASAAAAKLRRVRLHGDGFARALASLPTRSLESAKKH